MTGGKRIILLGSTFLMTGCVSDQNYHVRAIADPAAKFRYAGSLIAQGRAQLALGNVGLALETFRKAQREQPPSADTFAGIAACYAAMGRYDIARANYEFALAYAPSDQNLLTALANSLDQLGENTQAAQVRAEAARLAAAPAPTPPAVQAAQAKQAAVTPLDVPRLSSVTVALPSPVSKKPERPTPRVTAIAAKKAAPTIGAPQMQAPVMKISSTPLSPQKVELAASVETPMRSPSRAAQAPVPRAVAPAVNFDKKVVSSEQGRPSNSGLVANAGGRVPMPIELPKPAATEIAASRRAVAGKATTLTVVRAAEFENAAVPDRLRPANSGLAANAVPKVSMPTQLPKPQATETLASLPAATFEAATVPLAKTPTVLGKTAVSPASLRPSNAGLPAIAASKVPISIELRKPAAIETVARRAAVGVKPAASGRLEMAAQALAQSPAPVPVSEKRPTMPADRPREAIIAKAEPVVESGPHLQRLSLKEVALVTERPAVRPTHSKQRSPEAPLPVPTDVAMNVSRAEPAPHLASADAVSWVPLKYAPLQAPVQLLNAARTQSLAARTRMTLLDRGWHKVRIGNALRVRRHSLVLYASARWGVARRLAAYFGCKAVKSAKVRNVVVLLGRDAAMLRRSSTRA